MQPVCQHNYYFIRMPEISEPNKYVKINTIKTLTYCLETQFLSTSLYIRIPNLRDM